jgi:hypothetical protein
MKMKTGAKADKALASGAVKIEGKKIHYLKAGQALPYSSFTAMPVKAILCLTATLQRRRTQVCRYSADLCVRDCVTTELLHFPSA